MNDNMKKIFLVGAFLLSLVSCQEKYELNTAFSVPTALNGPSSLKLDVTSATPVVLSWTGGGADDGRLRKFRLNKQRFINSSFKKYVITFSVRIFRNVAFNYSAATARTISTVSYCESRRCVVCVGNCVGVNEALCTSFKD